MMSKYKSVHKNLEVFMDWLLKTLKTAEILKELFQVHDFLFGYCSWGDANRLLLSNPTGYCLIRFSETNPDNFILAVRLHLLNIKLNSERKGKCAKHYKLNATINNSKNVINIVQKYKGVVKYLDRWSGDFIEPKKDKEGARYYDNLKWANFISNESASVPQIIVIKNERGIVFGETAIILSAQITLSKWRAYLTENNIAIPENCRFLYNRTAPISVSMESSVHSL